MSVSKIGLRNAWFQVHKWIGLILAILIIPLSLSGAALVWHTGSAAHVEALQQRATWRGLQFHDAQLTETTGRPASISCRRSVERKSPVTRS